MNSHRRTQSISLGRPPEVSRAIMVLLEEQVSAGHFTGRRSQFSEERRVCWGSVWVSLWTLSTSLPDEPRRALVEKASYGGEGRWPFVPLTTSTCLVHGKTDLLSAQGSRVGRIVA